MKLSALSCLAIAFTALTAGGCSSAPPLFTSDGRATMQIVCADTNSAECDRRANVACPSGGYDVLSRGSAGSGQSSVYIACKRRATTY